MVVRGADVIVHPAWGIRRIGDKYPVDRTCVMRQAMSNRGRMLGQSHCVVKAGIAERPRGIAAVCMEIKIASDHECRLIDVRGAVRKDLFQLLDAQRVVTFALQ